MGEGEAGFGARRLRDGSDEDGSGGGDDGTGRSVALAERPSDLSAMASMTRLDEGKATRPLSAG